ncbi:hypothetical protein ACCT04_34925, partial [Rhizobium ruizarguesonis]
MKIADEGEIYRIAGQAIGRDRVPGDQPPMKNLQGQSDRVRKNDVSSQGICEAHRNEPWKPVVR